MSPAKLSDRLQSDFVRTELETGYKMLRLAMEQRNSQERDAAAQSLSLARVALAGAVEHLAAINLPRDENRELSHGVRELRRAIEHFENGGRAKILHTEVARARSRRF